MDKSQEATLALYEQIFAKMYGAIYILDITTGGIHWITDNETVRTNLGITAEQIVGMGEEFPKRLQRYPDYNESMTDAIAYFIQNPETKWIGLYRIQSLSGTYRWVMYSTSSFEFDAEGQLCKTITMAMDVTREINTNHVLTQYIRTSLHSQYADIYDLLSKREIEVINLTVQGKTTKEIATDLFLSHHTIESHKSNIFKKLDVGSSVELAQLAEKIGLLIEKI